MNSRERFSFRIVCHFPPLLTRESNDLPNASTVWRTWSRRIRRKIHAFFSPSYKMTCSTLRHSIARYRSAMSLWNCWRGMDMRSLYVKRNMPEGWTSQDRNQAVGHFTSEIEGGLPVSVTKACQSTKATKLRELRDGKTIPDILPRRLTRGLKSPLSNGESRQSSFYHFFFNCSSSSGTHERRLQKTSFFHQKCITTLPHKHIHAMKNSLKMHKPRAIRMMHFSARTIGTFLFFYLHLFSAMP